MATSTEIQNLINTLAAKTADGSITPTEVAAILTAVNANAAQNYSDVETLTGGTLTIGGITKPIYRLVVYGIVDTGSWYYEDLPNIDVILKSHVFVKQNGNSNVEFIDVDGTGISTIQLTMRIDPNSQTIVVSCPYATDGDKVYVVLEYTL